MNARDILLAVVAAVVIGTPALAQDLLIRGARVHTAGAAGTLEDSDVLVRGGKIAAIGAGLAAPADATIIEVEGRPLTPGLFGGLTQLGIEDVGAEASTVDSELDLRQPAWVHEWRPEFDVTRAFNPRSPVIPVNRIEGVTWTVLAPTFRDSLVTGQGAAITLDGCYNAVLGGRTLFVNWGSAAGRASGGSRAAQFMLFDQAIRETRDPASAGEGALLMPEGRAALKGYLAGGRVVFQVERAADIRAVIDYAKRQGMKPVISGGSEAWLVARELAEANVPVILNALDNLPENFDELGARLENAALLAKAGVQVAFSNNDSHQARKNRQLAGNAVANGLPWEVALRAVTSTPAQVFGLADRGRIEKGMSADLVLWSGDPLEVTSVAEQVWIAGNAIEMRSRQTELRERYLERIQRSKAP